MIIDQVNASTWTDADEFTSDENFANMIFSNVTVKTSEIPNSDTKYGNIKLQKTIKGDSGTLSKCWNIDLGKAKKTVTWTTKTWSPKLFSTNARVPISNQWLNATLQTYA